MKICHLIFSFTTGGSETMLVNILNEQVKTENVILIIINNLTDEKLIHQIDKRVLVIKINRRPSSKNYTPIIKINYLLYRLKPDVIHSHARLGGKLLLGKLRKKTILTVHSTKGPIPLNVYCKLFAISDAVKQYISQAFGLNSKVIYNGVAISNVKKKDILDRKPIFKIVQISRLEHLIKGQHLLMEALKEIVYNYKYTNIHVDFIGDGSSLDYLKQLATEYKVENHIAFLGLQSNDYIYKHLCEYDLLVQPSIYEGFGITVAEGMAAKVPVLVSNIEGPMEIIDNGEYGYHFKTENVESLCEALRNIIKHYADETNKQLVEQAYKHAIESFDVAATAKNYIENYQSL